MRLPPVISATLSLMNNQPRHYQTKFQRANLQNDAFVAQLVLVGRQRGAWRILRWIEAQRRRMCGADHFLRQRDDTVEAEDLRIFVERRRTEQHEVAKRRDAEVIAILR